MTENRFEERYQSGDTPWDHGSADCNLIDVVSRIGISRCRALDIGCGSGDNAIWLARQGFDVVACDLSPTAVQQAKGKLEAAEAAVRFLVADFLSDPVPDSPFGFVFDRGCLHCMDDERERKNFVEKVAGLLEEGGHWLSLVGNADEGEREVGPPQLTASELVSVVEPHFEILSLNSGHFGSDQAVPPRAWICLMRKRGD
ncbi:MAG TPA: methyltransferase domain-containing protein [Pontiella sp.]|nr:methyltransferase domain-containing protein [Pontiella sp.]